MAFENVVFINYVPGSYGTFLYHCLSPEIKLDIFTENGSAHTDLVDAFPQFHNFHSFNEWLSLTEEQKANTISDFEKLHSSRDPKKLDIQRIAHPKSTKIIKQYFPSAKIIKITIDNYRIYHVAEKFVHKVENIPISEAIGFVCDNIDNEEIEGVYNLPVRSFMNGTFINHIAFIRHWIGLPKADITELYEKFKQVNGLNK
jgi:hypothetical protein